MAVTVSIPGGNGAAPLIFKVSGISAGNYGLAFSNELLAASNLHINVLSNPGATQSTVGTVLNEILSNSSTTTYSLMNSGQHTLVDVGIATTVVGSAGGGDTVLATGATTYDAVGSNNNVDFVDGTNVYNGSSVAGATGDTITGGAGYDTINTGAGNSTVFSGAGHTLINLQDTVGLTGTNPGGFAYLGDGHATVLANGTYDDVVTGTNGQTIFGSSIASSTLNVVIGDNATSSGPAGDVINAGSGTTNIFDSVGGNSIFGGSGTLVFVGGVPSVGGTMSDSIVGGSGSSIIFGAAGDSITFGGDTTGSIATFSAGTGNETLNAANADGRVNFFGSSDSNAADTFVGSTTGYNYFQTGASTTIAGSSGTDTVSAGSESILGGTGTNLFGIEDGGPNSHVTVFDFAAGNDSVSFLGETAAQVQADLNGATVITVNGTPELTVTLSDNSTVTFVGITSLNGHVSGHS